MKLPIRDWQGFSDSWQTGFIQEQFLSLGHTAWQGYLIEGRGMVACEIAAVDATTTAWNHEVVRYRLQYIPAVAVPFYLQPYHLPTHVIHRLMDTLQAYSPAEEILFSVSKKDPQVEDEQIEIDWLRNLAIAPPDCHRQVCNRWDEFDLSHGSTRRPERRSPESRGGTR